MPRALSPQEAVLLQMDTDYLNAGMDVWESRVLIWTQMNNMPVLIYRTKDYGYATTDISDLGQSVINELAKQSEVHGMWYYLPQSIQEVVSERAENVAAVAKAAGNTVTDITRFVADAIGKTLHDLLAPLVDVLAPILILGVAIAAIYLTKKG